MKTLKTQFLKFLCIFSAPFISVGQVGIGTTTPDSSAALDIVSSTSGLLPPRMTQAEMQTLLATTPAKGLLVYCNDCTSKGIYVYNGNGFERTSGSPVIVSSTPLPCSLPVITDFECTAPSVGSYPSTLTTVANPSSTGINTSANVGRYVDNGTQGYDALTFDYGSPIDLSTHSTLKLKLYSPTSIQILAKLEGGTANREVWSNFSINEGPLNSWIEFSFDFSSYNNNSSSGGDMNTKIVLFFNAGVQSGSTTDVYYIDDVQWTN